MNTWPFPTKDSPAVPWTAKQQREYARQQRQQAPDAPFLEIIE